MRRVTGFVLAVILLVSVMFAGAMPVLADDQVASDACIALLKAEEGFSKYPYKDYSQMTVGYGTRCPDDMLAYYTANGITEEEAETLLRNHLVNVYDDLYKFAARNSLTFTQNQFDALVMFSYNVGTGWTADASGTVPKALVAGATGNDLIRALALWCNAGGNILTPLLRRRLCEANIYLNNEYSQTPPDHYCYVLYDANGGVSKPKSQGYDANLTAAPFPVPTYDGYVFDGWYTAKNGGTKVEVLDMTTKNATLYAHWKDANGNDVVEEAKSVKVTVNTDEVNFRKGPGTNYTKLGTKSTGDVLIITETASGSGYRWGKFDGGWIALMYTNYDTAVNDPNCIIKPGETTEPDTTPTEAPSTEAPSTEAPTTEAPTTEAPTTQAPTTQAPTTQAPTETQPAPAKVMGTVKVNGSLNIRGGTSTAHPVVGELKNGDRVEILEQKTVGAMVWGKISKGWISMTYVTLDGANSGGNSSSTQTWTGTVVSSEWLNIRSGAGTNFPIAGHLTPGEKVTITEQKTVGSMTWGKISKGWVSLSYVRLDGSGPSDNGSSNTGNTGSSATTGTPGTITTNSLRIRSVAGTASTVVGYLNTGAKVQILETTSVNGSAWGKIDRGWISMDYVKLDSASSGTTNNGGQTGNAGTTETPSQAVTGTVFNCTSYLNVRNGAGMDYSVVGYLYSGDQVTVTEQKTVGSVTWGKTAKGWVSMAYIKVGEAAPSAPQSQTVTVTANCLNIRKTAGTDSAIVGYLNYGAKVAILETTTVGSTSWGRTANGWISMQYVK